MFQKSGDWFSDQGVRLSTKNLERVAIASQRDALCCNLHICEVANAGRHAARRQRRKFFCERREPRRWLRVPSWVPTKGMDRGRLHLRDWFSPFGKGFPRCDSLLNFSSSQVSCLVLGLLPPTRPSASRFGWSSILSRR